MIYILFLCFVLRLQRWNMLLSLFTVVLSSDNSFLCFRQKAFLKSDVGWIHNECSFNLISYMRDLMKVWLLYHFIWICRAAFSLAFAQVGRKHPLYHKMLNCCFGLSSFKVMMIVTEDGVLMHGRNKLTITVWTSRPQPAEEMVFTTNLSFTTPTVRPESEPATST